MIAYLKKVFFQIDEFIKGLNPVKKVAMALTLAGIIIGMTALFFWAGDTSYSPLMTNLNPEDATNIIRVLRDKRIPFKVDPTGKNIAIPSERMYDLRLELATMGLPQSSVVGYEVFDKQTLGTTSFVQKVNQKRALEGELMRTINTINGVKRSRVHLAIPQKSTFVEDQKKPTASVVLDVDPSTALTEKQVFGIGNLVARAVEGMEVSDVVIVDSNGKTLSKNASDSLSAATANQLDFQQKVEMDLERRIEAMLSRVVGEGRVVAKVSAELDFSQVNETQTLVDADGAAVLSVDKRNDSASGTRPGPYGLGGAASNTPGAPPAANGEVRTETAKNNEVTNYEIPKTIRRTTKPSGTVKRLSVAVMVDGKTVKTPGKDGKVEAKIEPWSPEKIKEFETIVASAAGIDRKRGDILEIKNLEFTHEDFEEAQKVIAEKERKSYLQNLILYLVVGLTIALFFFFVVRPFIKWITENTIDSVDTFLPQTIEELERLQANGNLPGMEEAVPIIPEKMDPEKTEGEMIREKVVTLVDSNPHKAALILKDWLHVDASKKKVDDEGAAKGKSASANAS
ncbi:MAG: flagellar M-ring protein FliF [Bdellovibrionales bacterium RIFOXYD1_FULL_55_31]|nr:MAG: flagellar M-ring protein FliF [Bdellovibrionales bacterium RIFOXYD1_FULL_55_31]